VNPRTAAYERSPVNKTALRVSQGWQRLRLVSPSQTTADAAEDIANLRAEEQ